MQYFHDDLFDSGLSVITAAATAGTLRLVLLSQGTTVRSEAATLYDGAAGKYRLSSEITVNAGDVSIADKAGGGREITVAAKSGTAAATVSGQDLHYALYDDTRLLYVADETSNQAITDLNPINFPSFKFGFDDPIAA